MRPEQLCQQGFKMPELKNVNKLAINSLRIALKAYYSTYNTMSLYGISIFKDDPEDAYIHSQADYVEMYSETILHFQHFFELVIKDVLRAKSEILALKVDNQDVFIKLVLGETVCQNTIEKQKTVEFDVAFKRLRSLIDLDSSSEFSFFNEREVIETLNSLTIMRNRIWHRGSYVLRYYTLDIFIGKYVLPIVLKIMKTSHFNKFENRWRGSQNRLSIDPLEAITIEANEATPDLSKIAFLKEIGRSSYNNPLSKHGFKIFNDEIEKRAESIVNSELLNQYVDIDDINMCPTCGLRTLVGYLDTEFEYEDNEPIAGVEFIYQVKCHCCNFELRNLGMKNLKEYGYKNEPDYWIETKL